MQTEPAGEPSDAQSQLVECVPARLALVAEGPAGAAHVVAGAGGVAKNHALGV